MGIQIQIGDVEYRLPSHFYKVKTVSCSNECKPLYSDGIFEKLFLFEKLYKIMNNMLITTTVDTRLSELSANSEDQENKLKKGDMLLQ